MPQMNPLNWLTLFIMFSIIYMTFYILNYFNFIMFYPKNKFITINNKNNLNYYLNWKW